MLLNNLINNINILNSEVNHEYLKPIYLISKEFLMQNRIGFTMVNIENFLFSISFIRFTILAIRYNLKTSFILTCISFWAAFFWYIHLIDLIIIYRSYILKTSLFKGVAIEIFRLGSELEPGMEYQVPWYRPGLLLYYAFAKGIISEEYYIDPISMFISNLSESQKDIILPFYYKIYNESIPDLIYLLGSIYRQLGEIALYTAITRLGKRFCPYLVRWHWTFILLFRQFEPIIFHFFARVRSFHEEILLPLPLPATKILKANDIRGISKDNSFKIEPSYFTTKWLLLVIICLHLGFTLFGLFHALSGQFFYIPFLVENTELHTGFRPKNSIYTTASTPWQDDKKDKSFSYNKWLKNTSSIFLGIFVFLILITFNDTKQ